MDKQDNPFGEPLMHRLNDRLEEQERAQVEENITRRLDTLNNVLRDPFNTIAKEPLDD